MASRPWASCAPVSHRFPAHVAPVPTDAEMLMRETVDAMTIRVAATGFVTSIKVDYEDGPGLKLQLQGVPGPNRYTDEGEKRL